MTDAILNANIFLRYAEANSPQHPIVRVVIPHLMAKGYALFCFEQTCFEFWTVATRPIANNGLGLNPSEADTELTKLLGYFPLLENQPGLFAEWRTLVATHSISGKPSHDARYVAGMNIYGVTHILTFNTIDFARFPGIVALDPTAIAASITP
jgi:predicted nucleic acid-binding protein